MASAKQLPQLIGEFFDLARQYLRDAILEPAKQLGRLAGLGFAAAFVWMLAALFLGVAGMRSIVRVMPDGALWSGLGYVAATLALLGATGFVMWRATK